MPAVLSPRAAPASRGASVTSLRTSAVELLVSRFGNLHEGPRVFHTVVRLGNVAIPQLERLVRGRSQALYHSRRLAADALAAIATPEAVCALTRCLRDSIARDPDPVSLEAENVLVNRIAEHLSRFASPEVNDALLAALRHRPYPYCAAALGLLGDPRAIPLLIECLFEDTARSAAEGALLGFGRTALASLVQVLREPRTVAGAEPPTHVDARVAAARLVGACIRTGTLIDAHALRALDRALSDGQRSVRVEAALALVGSDAMLARDAAPILAMALDDANWGRAHTLVAALVRLGSSAEPWVIAVLSVRPRTDADRRRRLRAVEVLGRLGSAQDIAKLRRLAGSADPELRLASVAALGKIPAVDSGSLKHFLVDREAAVRCRALQALQRRNALTADCAAQLLGDDAPDIRRLAVASVRADRQAALPALHRAAFRFGAPLHGWGPRFRLWWRAWALIAVRRASSINLAATSKDP